MTWGSSTCHRIVEVNTLLKAFISDLAPRLGRGRGVHGLPELESTWLVIFRVHGRRTGISRETLLTADGDLEKIAGNHLYLA